jgi:hypothetical protein
VSFCLFLLALYRIDNADIYLSRVRVLFVRLRLQMEKLYEYSRSQYCCTGI